MKRRLRTPSPALVVSLVALFVALGGTTYAATTLAANSVGTKQLKKNAVTSPKIKKGAVTASKINTSGLTVPHAAGADNASKLGGVPAAGFLTVNGIAADSQKLGGLSANQYTQGRGSQVFRRAVAQPGGSVEFLSLGFGTLTGSCSGNIPQIGFTPDRDGENFFATIFSDSSPVATDTENAIPAGTTVPEPNSNGHPQMITFQISFTDVVDHVASIVATGEYLNGTGCLFVGQGVTTG
jgi:hypothetical protein